MFKFLKMHGMIFTFVLLSLLSRGNGQTTEKPEIPAEAISSIQIARNCLKFFTDCRNYCSDFCGRCYEIYGNCVDDYLDLKVSNDAPETGFSDDHTDYSAVNDTQDQAAEAPTEMPTKAPTVSPTTTSSTGIPDQCAIFFEDCRKDCNDEDSDCSSCYEVFLECVHFGDLGQEYFYEDDFYIDYGTNDTLDQATEAPMEMPTEAPTESPTSSMDIPVQCVVLFEECRKDCTHECTSCYELFLKCVDNFGDMEVTEEFLKTDFYPDYDTSDSQDQESADKTLEIPKACAEEFSRCLRICPGCVLCYNIILDCYETEVHLPPIRKTLIRRSLHGLRNPSRGSKVHSQGHHTGGSSRVKEDTSSV